MLVYSYTAKAGFWVLFPLIPLYRAQQTLAFRFDFDSDGIVRNARIEKGPPTGPTGWWLTDSPRPPPMLQDLPWPDHQATTRPD